MLVRRRPQAYRRHAFGHGVAVLHFARAHVESAIKPGSTRDHFTWRAMAFAADRRCAHHRRLSVGATTCNYHARNVTTLVSLLPPVTIVFPLPAAQAWSPFWGQGLRQNEAGRVPFVAGGMVEGSGVRPRPAPKPQSPCRRASPKLFNLGAWHEGPDFAPH